jgi:AcrR family transcriptional regulator
VSSLPSAGAAGKPRRSRLSAEDRRASIVAAATEVFARSGYQRGRMSEVAARLGVTEPVVFQNFGSKAALYAAVVEHAADHMAAAVLAAADAGVPVGGLLGHLVAPPHLDHLHSPGAPGMIFADAMGLTSEPLVQEAARRGIRRLAGTLTALLERGQRSGQVAPDVSPQAAAWWVLSLMASYGFRVAVMPDRDRLEAELAELTLRVLGGR